MIRAPRLLLVGDPHGLPQLLNVLPPGCVAGLVGATIRPHQHAALRALAACRGVPLLLQPKPRDPGHPAFVEAVRAIAPDLILVNSYAMRLPAEILAIPPHGGVNVHGALLPRYRGASPLQNAILNGEQETGVTMHVMTPAFDDGPILAQRRVPLYVEDTWRDAYRRIAGATEAMLEAVAPALLRLRLEGRQQDERLAGYCPRRHPEDGLIDWDRSVRYLYDLVRALVHPHPGAFWGEGEARVVLDRLYPLGAIAALKFGPAGGDRRCGAAVALEPAGARLADLDRLSRLPHDRLRFAIRAHGRLAGRAELSLALADRQAALAVRWRAAPAPAVRREALALLLGFAFRELELEAVHAALPWEQIVRCSSRSP